MRSGEEWTNDDLDALESWYPEFGTQCPRWWANGGKLLEGRSHRAIAAKAARIGLKCRYRGPRVWPHAHDRMAIAMLAKVCRETGRSPYQVLDHLRSLVQNNQRRSLRIGAFTCDNMEAEREGD